MNFIPRSGDLQAGGISWLPRMIDKARARHRQNLGEYTYPCPLDEQLLQRLGIDADTFEQLAVAHEDDEAVLDAVRQHTRPR